MSHTFKTPIHDRYFEDYVPGTIHEFGNTTVTEAEIIAFAKVYDPQYFHTDPEAAKQSIYGGLIASGIQTFGLATQQLIKHFISHVASLGSPGVDEVRWIIPVRPGDTLSLRAQILETRRSKSKPDRGIVHYYLEMLNQNKEIVMTVKVINMFRCRNS
jgi:acyl dehydratase